MWSNKKVINITVNVLLFLVGINIFRCGQLLLPVICLILFVDNKFKLNIKNKMIFIVLVLFGISFFAFTYKQGLYSTIGFCLPMAYYIGSNLKETNEDNVKKIIYILALGMSFHVALNMFYNISIYGSTIFQRPHHYDIWTKEIISSTGIAVNYTLLISVVYYIIIYETNKIYKWFGILLFTILLIYNISLGRRTPVLMLVVVLVFSYIYDFLINKRKVNKKVLKCVIIIAIAIVTIFIAVFAFNIFDLRIKFIYSTIFLKFYNFGLDSERIQLFIDGIKLAPNYLWGGQHISGVLETQIHDLWMDTYDYAGIIPFVLLMIYTFIAIIDLYDIVKNKIKNKLLFVSVLLCITIQLLLEPVITGTSIFLLSAIIIISAIEGIKD